MDSQILRRPEVQLGTCPRDGGDMFRQFGESPVQWICGECGLITRGDPSAESSLSEEIAV